MRPATATALLVVILLIIIGVFLLVSRTPQTSETTSTNAPAAQEAITFPTGSDTLNAAGTYTLAWNNPSAGTTTQIFLIDTALESQGESVSITDRVYNVPNTGSYAYTVPANVPAGTYVLAIGQLRSEPFHIASSTH
jgi:hypothetical protein